MRFTIGRKLDAERGLAPRSSRSKRDVLLLDDSANGARGRIRTCTGGALDAVPLLLGYTSED